MTIIKLSEHQLPHKRNSLLRVNDLLKQLTHVTCYLLILNIELCLTLCDYYTLLKFCVDLLKYLCRFVEILILHYPAQK